MAVSLRAKKAASITLCPGERLFVGIDVHKRSHHVSVWSRGRGLVSHWVQPASSAVVLSRLRPLREQIEMVVHEAGPTGFGLVRALRAEGYRAEVIAPAKLPMIMGEAKCDRLDSGRLAQFACEGLVRPISVPTPQQEGDRETVRARATAVGDVRRAKQRIRSFLLRHTLAEPRGWGVAAQAQLRTLVVDPGLRACFDSLLEALCDTLRRLSTMGAAVRALAAEPRHAPALAHLTSVPGVGLVTAMIFRTELFCPERFDRAEEISAFIGLAPRVRSSGQSRREGPITKAGNMRLRTALIESAWQWVRYDTEASRRYRHLVGQSGCAQKAITAMARHLAILLWRLSVRGEDYRAKA